MKDERSLQQEHSGSNLEGGSSSCRGAEAHVCKSSCLRYSSSWSSALGQAVVSMHLESRDGKVLQLEVGFGCVQTMEAVRHALRQLHSGYWLAVEGAGIVHHKPADVTLGVVDICQQVPIIFTCTTLSPCCQTTGPCSHHTCRMKLDEKHLVRSRCSKAWTGSQLVLTLPKCVCH